MDAVIASLTAQTQQLQQQLNEQAMEKELARKLAAEERLQSMLKLEAQLREESNRHAELKRKVVRKALRRANRDLDSANRQMDKVQHQEREVNDLKRRNARNAAMLRDTATARNIVHVGNLPRMTVPPAWSSAVNWQPYQNVKQQLYRLEDGKLVMTDSRDTVLRFSLQHFATGGFRYVFYAKDPATGAKYVAKRLYTEHCKMEENMRAVEADIRDHMVAAQCANKFQHQANKARIDVPRMAFTPSVSLLVANSTPAAYPAADHGKVMYFLEPFVSGAYCKWTLNTGEIIAKPALEDARAASLAQALAHFSYHQSSGQADKDQYMITDIQGFKHPDGVFTLIDPAICRLRRSGVVKAGADYGLENAVREFSRSHCCSAICKGLHLRPVSA